MNTAVVKATKHDGNIPKTKHVIALCSFSWENKVTVKNMLDQLGDRLRAPNWDVVYKTLIVIHTLMRDGCPENVFEYLARSPGLLDTSGFRPKSSSSGVSQIKNIRTYSQYLEHKVIVYHQKKVDFASAQSDAATTLFTDKIDSKFFEAINLIQDHLEVLLNAKLYDSEVDNHIILYAFKMLIRDLLKIYQGLNQGVITILKNFFELPHKTAELCLKIYTRFIKLTNSVISYLNSARDIESYLQFSIPELKHAPVSLLSSLEEHLKSTKNTSTNYQPSNIVSKDTSSKSNLTSAQNKAEAIDFFASLDDELAMANFQPTVPTINFNPIQSPPQPQAPRHPRQVVNTSTNFNPFNELTSQQRPQTAFLSNPTSNSSFNSNPFPNQIRSATLPNSNFNPFQIESNNSFNNPNLNNNNLTQANSISHSTNPFATMRSNSLSPVQSSFQSHPNLQSTSRNTMNPFLMDAAFPAIQPNTNTNPNNIGSPFSNPINNTNNNNSNNNNMELSNLFNQHQFGA